MTCYINDPRSAIKQIASNDCQDHEEVAVDSLFNEMKDALLRGDGIELRNFVIFEINQKKDCIGRNPRTSEVADIPPGKNKTGQAVEVPPKRVVYFKVGKELKSFLAKAEGVS